MLLPRVREEIAERKKLSFHLYASLKKALYKPEAWFRGILLPLCESRTCTIQEANILGSLLAKTSIPVVHSAAAMLKITQLPYSGARRPHRVWGWAAQLTPPISTSPTTAGASSLFLRILIDKKYALPYMVIDISCPALRARPAPHPQPHPTPHRVLLHPSCTPLWSTLQGSNPSSGGCLSSGTSRCCPSCSGTRRS